MGTGQDDEDYDDSPYPVQVKGPDGIGVLTDVVKVAASEYFAMALKNDGTVWTWGGNLDGSLGDGSDAYHEIDSYTPIQVKSPDGSDYLTNIIDIAIGDAHAIVLKNDGTVWVWGQNSAGQLGNGSIDWETHSLPQQVKYKDENDQLIPLTDIVSVGAGQYNSYALNSNGEVWAWGQYSKGSLGDGSITNKVYPIKIMNGSEALKDITFITGSGGYEDYTLAIDKNQRVWGWGANYYGQLGRPLQNPWFYTTPGISEDMPGLKEITYIAAGEEHALTVDKYGDIWALGYNKYGQLGIGSYDDGEHAEPVKPLVPSESDPVEELYASNPDVAYDPINTKYLLVYENSIPDEYANIYGRFIDADGDTIGEEFLISDSSGLETTPKVAFNAEANKFLVVWSSREKEYPGGDYVKGRFIDTIGNTPSGEIIKFNDKPNSSIMGVDVVAGESNFLVVWDKNEVWEGENNRKEIHGSLLSEAGTNIKSIVISPASGSDVCYAPSLAYGNGNYLLTYQQNSNSGWNIKTTYINEAGEVGQSYLLTNDSYDQTNPEAVYIGNDRFMVTWEDIDGIGKYVAAQVIDTVQSSGEGLYARIKVRGNVSSYNAKPIIAFSNSYGEALLAWMEIMIFSANKSS